VLAAANRMRSSADFSAVTRHGRRIRSGALVVYVLQESIAAGSTESQPRSTVDSRTRALPGQTQVGLIVGKKVGPSVARHSVSRRLREQLRSRLDLVPEGSRIVVRALEGCSTQTSFTLGRDLDRAFARLQR
jgi:ribonuclease P protein component